METIIFKNGICPRCGWGGAQEAEDPNRASMDPTMLAYIDGANLALYLVAWAFCVKSDDIRLAEIPIQDKAKLLAQRIQEEMGENDGTTDNK